MDDTAKNILDEFNRRTIYESLDPKTLAGIADKDLEKPSLTMSSVSWMDVMSRKGRFSPHSQREARAFWLTWVVEGEVNNGGFNQYYWNTNDRFATDAVDAFRCFLRQNTPR